MKWKNYGMWTSLLSLIGLLLQNYGVLNKIGLTGDLYNQIVNWILTFLVGMGILSNPNDGKWYSNNK